MSPCRWILWHQGAVQPPLSLTGGTSGEEEKENWWLWGRPRWDFSGWCRSDPAPCSRHPGELVEHSNLCSPSPQSWENPSLPLQAGAVTNSLIPAAQGQAVCVCVWSTPGSVSLQSPAEIPHPAASSPERLCRADPIRGQVPTKIKWLGGKTSLPAAAAAAALAFISQQ